MILQIKYRNNNMDFMEVDHVDFEDDQLTWYDPNLNTQVWVDYEACKRVVISDHGLTIYTRSFPGDSLTVTALTTGETHEVPV